MTLRRRHIKLYDCDTGKELNLLIGISEFCVIVSMGGEEVFGMDYWSEGNALRVVKWDENGEVEDEMTVEVGK